MDAYSYLSYYKKHFMHPEDIKASLRKLHSSMAEIARELGVSRTTVGSVVKGMRSRRIERAISDKLGKPLHEVFPNRYSKDEVA